MKDFDLIREEINLYAEASNIHSKKESSTLDTVKKKKKTVLDLLSYFELSQLRSQCMIVLS